MKIGILGAGRMGGNLGRLWTNAGHEVMFGSRNPAQLQELVAEVGDATQAGTLGEAIAFGQVLLLAYPYAAHQEMIEHHGEQMKGKILIDATNPFGRGIKAPDGCASGEVTAEWFPESQVVRAFSHIYAASLMSEAHRDGDLVAVALAGDDEQAKHTVAQLITNAGFVPVDLGALSKSMPLDPYGILWMSQVTEHEMRALLTDG